MYSHPPCSSSTTCPSIHRLHFHYHRNRAKSGICPIIRVHAPSPTPLLFTLHSSPVLWAAVPPPQKSSRFSPFKVPCSEVPQRAAPADPDSSLRCSSSRATMHVAYHLPVCSRPAGPLEHVWLRIALASSVLPILSPCIA